MTITRSPYTIGCNVIDPLLQVGPGSDYDMPITQRSLEFLAQCGFDAVEFSHCQHWTDEQLEQVRAMAHSAGIGVWSIHAWRTDDIRTEEGAAAVQAMLSRAVDIAAGLGAGVIVHHPVGMSVDQENGSLLPREAQIIRAAWRSGVRFAVENLKDVPQMQYIIALADELGAQVAGICVDTGHANIEHADTSGRLDAARAIRMAGTRLITTHVQDNEGYSDQHMAPGDGSIDWDDVAAALREVGYEGCLMLELTDHPSEDRVPHIQQELRGAAETARTLAALAFGP